MYPWGDACRVKIVLGRKIQIKNTSVLETGSTSEIAKSRANHISLKQGRYTLDIGGSGLIKGLQLFLQAKDPPVH